jgi:hypothetical protein
MVFKKYYASPHSYLLLKIRISDEWAEQLPLPLHENKAKKNRTIKGAVFSAKRTSI